MYMWMDVAKSFFSIALELSILFVLISFIINLIQGIIPYQKIERYLFGKNLALGIVFTLVFAFVTPFCSCSTIPVVVNMLNKKMRFGVVMIFLFASPVLDPTILTMMAYILGIKVAIIFTVVTSIFSIIMGLMLEKLGYEKYVKKVFMTGFKENAKTFDFELAFKETMSMMKSVFPYLILGALIGSIIQGAVPSEWISSIFGGNEWWLIPLAAVVGIPLYIRLSTMIPISQILIAKGMALAPIMTLMISSVGASLPEITLLNSIFKKQLVTAFVLSVVLMATLSGYLFYII